jgi:hypothetical protein
VPAFNSQVRSIKYVRLPLALILMHIPVPSNIIGVFGVGLRGVKVPLTVTSTPLQDWCAETPRPLMVMACQAQQKWQTGLSAPREAAQSSRSLPP